MPDYMCDVKGNYYKIGVTYTSGSSNTNNTKCTVKGDNVPVLEWARSAWRNAPDTPADDFVTMNGNWAGGRVMFLTDVIYDPLYQDNYIYAICFLWEDEGIAPDLATRQAATAYPHKFYIATMRQRYIAGFDYRKFIVNYGTSDYQTNGPKTWCPTFSGTYAEILEPGLGGFTNYLVPVIDWQDGQGGGGLAVNTLMIPDVYMMWYQGDAEYAQWIQCFITRIIDNDDPDGDYYKDYNWLTVGETADERFLLYQSYADFRSSSGLPVCGSAGHPQLKDYLSGFSPEPPIPPGDDPFESDYNEGGGGDGDYRDTSDEIPQDGVPTVSALSTGFIRAYELSNAQINDLYSYLMTDNFLDNVKKLMSDPIDYIVSLMLAPYSPTTGSSTTIHVGGVDTGVGAVPIISGYKNIDCGTIQLKEFWGKYLDYNPYTKVQIYLPFIGIRPLDIDDVMSAQVTLTYRIDVLTGACVATVAVNNVRGTKGAIYYFNGNCHSHVPVTGKNYLDILGNVMRAGSGLAGAISQSNPLGIASGSIDVMRSSREIIEHAGELQGSHGLLANYTPFLIVSRPSQSLAQNFKHYKGYISNVTKTLSTLTGYTEVAELVQTNIHCTESEFDEINDLLKSGVYL